MKRQPMKFIMVAASLIPQHFKFEHEHELSALSDEELRQQLLEVEPDLAKAGITIDLEAKEVVALPPPLFVKTEVSDKPKGMNWRTHDRLRRLHEAAEMRSTIARKSRLAMMPALR